MIYAMDVLGFSIMDSHFYLRVDMSLGDMCIGRGTTAIYPP